MHGRIVQASVVPHGLDSIEIYTGAQIMTAAATTLAALAIINF